MWSINGQIRSSANSVWVQSSLRQSDKHHSLPPILHNTDGQITQHTRKSTGLVAWGWRATATPMNCYSKKKEIIWSHNATKSNGLGRVWVAAPPQDRIQKQENWGTTKYNKVQWSSGGLGAAAPQDILQKTKENWGLLEGEGWAVGVVCGQLMAS